MAVTSAATLRRARVIVTGMMMTRTMMITPIQTLTNLAERRTKMIGRKLTGTREAGKTTRKTKTRTEIETVRYCLQPMMRICLRDPVEISTCPDPSIPKLAATTTTTLTPTILSHNLL